MIKEVKKSIEEKYVRMIGTPAGYMVLHGNSTPGYIFHIIFTYSLTFMLYANLHWKAIQY